MFCFLQNRNSRATRRGRDGWERLKARALAELSENDKRHLGDIMEDRRRPWGLFAPSHINEYWLPGTIALLWIAGGLVPVLD